MVKRDVPAPAAISAEARAFIETAPPLVHRPVTADRIDEIRHATRAAFAARCEAVAARLAVRIDETEIAGVAVETVVPKDHDGARDDRALLYFHGGGHIVGSPFEDLCITAPLAERLGVKVHAVRYRLAPEHPFPAGLDDACAVFRALLGSHDPARLAVAGESAGGNLALALLLRARDAGLALPAAAALLSPWSDLSKTGDSATTLAGLDPTLHYEMTIKDAAAAYAGARDLTDPLVSPVYADYRPGFPPCLITTGTRDLFLSDCARLSTKMRLAGVDATLHVWEGMWHVFEFYSEIPEAGQSLAEIGAFLDARLNGD